MPNPWLSVPLADYEGHMRDREVAQLDSLADLFAEALALFRPPSVAVLGIAGGNGLDRIDSAITRRVLGLDVNPLYLEAVRRRYSQLGGLKLVCADLAEPLANCTPVELVHAALIFEHAGIGCCLENAVTLVAPQGALSVVLQLASDREPGVAITGFGSIRNLEADFGLVDPKQLRTALEQRGFRLTHETRRPLPSGKGFWMGIFRREPAVL